jgi:hypothetical protein
MRDMESGVSPNLAQIEMRRGKADVGAARDKTCRPAETPGGFSSSETISY